MVFMTFVVRQGFVLDWGTVVCLALTSSFGRALVSSVSSGGLSCIASAYIVMHLIREITHVLLSLRGGSIVGDSRGSRGRLRGRVMNIVLRILVNNYRNFATMQVTHILVWL